MWTVVARAGVCVALVALFWSAAAGCGRRGATRADDPPPPPLRVRLRQAAEAEAETPFFVLRYNPAPESCGCPPAELRLDERWFRLRLTPRSAAAPLVTDFEERAARDLRDGRKGHYYAVGRLDRRPVPVCRNGEYGFELQVEEFFDSPPESPDY